VTTIEVNDVGFAVGEEEVGAFDIGLFVGLGEGTFDGFFIGVLIVSFNSSSMRIRK